MKRRKLLRYLADHSVILIREGAKHSIYGRLDSHQQTTIPRHTEIGEHLCREICKQLEIPAPGENIRDLPDDTSDDV